MNFHLTLACDIDLGHAGLDQIGYKLSCHGGYLCKVIGLMICIIYAPKTILQMALLCDFGRIYLYDYIRYTSCCFVVHYFLCMVKIRPVNSPGVFDSYLFFIRGSRKLCQRRSTFDIFLNEEGKRLQMQLKVGHHRPASETPLKWRFAGVPMMAQH